MIGQYMENSYQINYAYISLENIEEILKKIAQIIVKPSKNILDKLMSGSTPTEDKTDEIHNYENIVVEIDDNKKIEMYNLVDSIAGLLKKDDFFYDEYFDFCEIQDMIKDTLNRDEIKESDLVFLLNLVFNFSKLIYHKLNLKENDNFNSDDYESVYNLFLTKFNESQSYFYEKICDESLDDDLFIEYTNIIME